jgi:hypothetical protein
MAHVNNELGINIRPIFDDLVINGGYENTSGERQLKRLARKKERVEKRVERKEARQERRELRRDARNTQKITAQDRVRANDWIQFNYIQPMMNAKSLQELGYYIDTLSDTKATLLEMIGKRKSGVGTIVSFGRKYKRSGKGAGMCSSNECIRESRARLDAIKLFETEYKNKIEILAQRLPERVGVTPNPNQVSTKPVAIASFDGQNEVESTTDVTNINEPKKMNQVALYVIGGLLLIGAVRYFKK